VGTLRRQARFHDGITRLLEAWSQLSATHAAVAAQLRGASSAAAELEVITDTSVIFRTPVASGVVCAVTATGVELAPELLTSGQHLTHIASSPVPGDSVWLFDEGVFASSLDDRWIGAAIAAVSRPTGVCAGSPYVHPILDATRTGWQLTFTSAPAFPAGAGRGSALRITRRARLAFYRTGTGDFALGYAEWNPTAGAWDVIQPLSGAFLPLNRGNLAASGIAFTALDSSSAPLAPGTLNPGVARITLIARALTRGVVRIEGMRGGIRSDSLISATALRNHP
jgi:hypothetical protein